MKTRYDDCIDAMRDAMMKTFEEVNEGAHVRADFNYWDKMALTAWRVLPDWVKRGMIQPEVPAPIVPAEWQYHEMLRHGAKPNRLFGMMDGPFETPVDDAVAAWNRRRVAEPDAPWPYDVQAAYQNTLLPPNYMRPHPMMNAAASQASENDYAWQLFPKPGEIYPGVGYVDAGMA